MNRRDATKLITLGGVGLITASCERAASPAAPGSAWLTPLSQIVNPDPKNASRATLRHYGYAPGDGLKLVDYFRSLGYELTITSAGLVTSFKSVRFERGWMFAIENSPFGQTAGRATINQGQLWGAYEKLDWG